MKHDTKLKPSDLRVEAERLLREKKMPSLNQVLEAIREVKEDPKHDAPVIHEALVRTGGKKQ